MSVITIERRSIQLNSSSKTNSHCQPTVRPDYLLWISSTIVLAGVGGELVFKFMDVHLSPILAIFLHSQYALLRQMSIGILIGILSVGLLHYVPRHIIMKFFGPSQSVKGLLKATFGGLLLDLCSHGILMVGMKLYERGVSLGQVMAFLIASPWNSFSLSVILITLIGWKWTLCFIVLSSVIAFVSGLIFEALVKSQVLPPNPYSKANLQNMDFHASNGESMAFDLKNPHFWLSVLRQGFQGSKIIIKWMFVGIIIASLMRAFVDPGTFAYYFGPTFLGLFLTVVVASIVEVCSEGSTPIAAEFMKQAPGNTFAFLMTGVSTDYTEIMSIKETAKSWKVAMFLPLVTLPQIFVISLVINDYSH